MRRYRLIGGTPILGPGRRLVQEGEQVDLDDTVAGPLLARGRIEPVEEIEPPARLPGAPDTAAEPAPRAARRPRKKD